MKKLLVSFCSLAVAVGAFGQGQVLSQNSGATAITNNSMGQVAARAALSTRVGFYANANNNATPTSPGWILAGGTTNLTAPGVFLGGVRIYTGFLPGNAAAFQVRAWLTTGTYANYESALAAEGATGGAFGQSVVMQITPNDPAGTAPAPNFLNNGFQSFNIATIVPEPSSIALGLLGLGAVALFRRRK
jgi:hypothetical protein